MQNQLNTVLREERDSFKKRFENAEIEGHLFDYDKMDMASSEDIMNWITTSHHRILTAIRSEIEEMKLDDDKDNHEEFCGLYAGVPCDCDAKVFNTALTHVQELIDGVLKD